MKKYKIIVDSSSDLYSDYIKDDNIAFSIAPLTINVGQKAFIDDDHVDPVKVLHEMGNFSGKSTTSCPAPGEFLEQFEGAECCFVVTISSKLSGSFNSAFTAVSNSVDKKVHLIDSKLVSGTMILLVDELVRLIRLDLSYEEICGRIDDFNNQRSLLFVLNKFDNLVKNGRMSKFMGIIATTLRIVPLCEGHEGEIRIAEKTITQKSAYRKLVEGIKSRIKGVPENCIITHCYNESGANYVKDMIKEKSLFKSIRILPMKGLCSFYALKGGIIVCF